VSRWGPTCGSASIEDVPRLRLRIAASPGRGPGRPSRRTSGYVSHKEKLEFQSERSFFFHAEARAVSLQDRIHKFTSNRVLLLVLYRAYRIIRP
jgi:hypothetical protein